MSSPRARRQNLENLPMKYKSTLLAQASGALAGTVFSRNRGGLYTRSRAIPVNPCSAQQVAVRNRMGILTARWLGTLTDAQRDDWKTYSANVLMPDRLGDPRDIGAMPHYLRSNLARMQAGLDPVDAGPTDFSLPSMTEPTVSCDVTDQEVDLVIDNTDDWANEDDGALIVLVSRPVNPTINYWSGPYRYAGLVAGDDATPPTSPATVSLPFAVVAGQKVFVQVRVARADGRLGTPFRASAVGA